MDRSIALGMLAELVEGQVVGDAATVIRGAAVLREVARGEITFIDQAERVKQLADDRGGRGGDSVRAGSRSESGTTWLAERRSA